MNCRVTYICFLILFCYGCTSDRKAITKPVLTFQSNGTDISGSSFYIESKNGKACLIFTDANMLSYYFGQSQRIDLTCRFYPRKCLDYSLMKKYGDDSKDSLYVYGNVGYHKMSTQLMFDSIYTIHEGGGRFAVKNKKVKAFIYPIYDETMLMGSLEFDVENTSILISKRLYEDSIVIVSSLNGDRVSRWSAGKETRLFYKRR